MICKEEVSAEDLRKEIEYLIENELTIIAVVPCSLKVYKKVEIEEKWDHYEDPDIKYRTGEVTKYVIIYDDGIAKKEE